MRWPAATGVWLAVPVWVYAVLAAFELRTLDYDPTAPPESYASVSDQAPALIWVTAFGLGAALILALVSLTTGRLRRVADLLLGLGLAAGGAMLWAVGQAQPVAPVVVGVAGALLVVSAALPAPGEPGPVVSWLARLLLATAALLAGQVVLHELDERSFQLRPWTVGYWAGLALVAGLLIAAVLGPRLASGVWRWLLAVPLLVIGLLSVAWGVLGLDEGFLVSGFNEIEDGWRLGGAVLFAGAGCLAAGIGALRRRWVFAVGTAGSTVLLLLALLFGVPEIRRGY